MIAFPLENCFCKKGKLLIFPNIFRMCLIVWYDSSMLAQYTSEQVAKRIGYTRSRVLQVCKKLELPRVGNQYVLGEKEIEIIKDALGHKPTGRPKKQGLHGN